MKDQITTLMEALRLVSLEVEHFKRRRQGREDTLSAIEAILDDSSVMRAVQSIQPFVQAPALVPETTDAPALV